MRTDFELQNMIGDDVKKLEKSLTLRQKITTGKPRVRRWIRNTLISFFTNSWFAKVYSAIPREEFDNFYNTICNRRFDEAAEEYKKSHADIIKTVTSPNKSMYSPNWSAPLVGVTSPDKHARKYGEDIEEKGIQLGAIKLVDPLATPSEDDILIKREGNIIPSDAFIKGY